MHKCRVEYHNNDNCPGCYGYRIWQRSSENMFNKIGRVRWRSPRGESGHGSEVWNEETGSDFKQAVAVVTLCSPPLLSSFLTLSSCLLTTCSLGHIGYFSISGNSQAHPPLSVISTPYQLFLPLVRWVRSNYSQLDPMVLISLTVYLFAFCCLIGWGVVHLSYNQQNTGSLYLTQLFTKRKLNEHSTAHHIDKAMKNSTVFPGPLPNINSDDLITLFQHSNGWVPR